MAQEKSTRRVTKTAPSQNTELKKIDNTKKEELLFQLEIKHGNIMKKASLLN